MKSLADLRAIKEQAKKDLAAREQQATFRVSVAMGTCGIAAGARNVMSAILDEMSKRNIENAIVSQTGCLGYCDQEPLIQITQPDQSVITYGKVTPEVARQIIASHLVNNKILSDYVFMQK